METLSVDGLFQRLDLGEHPRLVVVAGGGIVSYTPDDRNACMLGGLFEERCGQRVGDLLVVDEHLDLVP